MKKILIVLLALFISACTTNGVYDPGKTWMLVGGIVVGAYLAEEAQEEKEKEQKCSISIDQDMPCW